MPTILLDALRARGLRVTPQRAIILEAIEQLPGHMTAEQIYTHVQAERLAEVVETHHPLAKKS